MPLRPLLIGSLATQSVLYLGLALALRPTSDPAGVAGFLALMTLSFAIYALVIRATAKQPAGASFGLLLAGAIAFRLALLPAGLPHGEALEGLQRDLGSEETGYETFLLYDNDAWRYLWDGAVLARGHSPYAAAPAELEARYVAAESSDPEAQWLIDLFESGVWVEVFDNLSFLEYRTVYGPLAQATFAFCALVAPGSVLLLKVLFLLAELGALLLLARLAQRHGRPEWFVATAWNPLLIKETAGSAHVESLAIGLLFLAFLLGLQRRWSGAACAAGAASLVKLSSLPVVALVAVAAWRAAGFRDATRAALAGGFTVGLGLLPFVRDLPAILDALRTFAAEWMFNPGPFLVVRALSDAVGLDGWSVAGGLALLLPFAASCAVVWRAADDDGPTRWAMALLVLLGGTVWLSATVNPWYLIWALPFATIAGFWPWLVLTGTVQLSYLFYLDQTEHAWTLLVGHGAFAVACVVWLVQRRRHPK